jgi:hypothetical protein
MPLRDAIGWLGFGPHPRDTALASLAAVNRRDWAQLRALLADDFFYLDGEENRIESADRFIASLRCLVRDAPDFRVDIDSFEDAGRMVYMRGRTVSSDARFRSRSMWRTKVERGRLVCLENFRPGSNNLPLDRYAPEHA